MTSQPERWSAGPEASGDTSSRMSGLSRDTVQARDISGGVHFHPSSELPPMAPAQLPGDLYGFVNRTRDLELIDSLLSPADGSLPESAVCVVTGTPGVGKTSLAIHWAHRVRERFSDGQLYINLRGYDWELPLDAHRVLGGFLIALGVAPGAVPVELEERSSLYRSLLSGRQVLVVLDNAATSAQVIPLLPGAGRSKVLVTTRGLLGGLAMRGGARRVTLSLLSKADSVELLRMTTGLYRSQDSEQDIAELAGLCARLPLALRIAAERAAARPRMTLSELIQDLKDESSLWVALSNSDPEDADAVRSVFAWSYRALPEAAARLFRLLGVFPGTDFSSSTAAALAGIAPASCRRLLGDLADAHLLEQLAADRYEFHDLLRAYAGAQAQQIDSPAEISAALRRLVEWYLRCAEALLKMDPYAHGHRYVTLPLPADDGPVAGFESYERAISWFHDERANLTAIVRAALESGLPEPAWQIPALLRHIYDRERVFDDWFAVTTLGLKAATLLGNDEGRIYLLESLGRAHYAQHSTESAAECYSELLELCRASGDFFGEAVTLNAIGLVEVRRHHMAEAISCFERCETLCLEHDLRELTVNPATNLTQAMLEFGRPQEALELGRTAVRTNRRVGSRQAEMYALLRLSAAELEVGRVEQAQEHVEQARALADISQSRAEEGIALHYAGGVLLARERTVEALEAFQRSVLIARSGGDRQREALALRGVGLAHRAAGRQAEALEVDRAVVLAWRSLGDGWQSALSLAELVIDLGSGAPSEAREAATEALRLIETYADPAAARLRDFFTTALHGSTE